MVDSFRSRVSQRGVGVLAFATFIAPNVACAQASAGTAAAVPATAESQIGVGDIVVTARRTEENLQRVPASIGVLSSADLQARKITSFQDLKSAVANLATTRTSTPGGGYLSIRGQSGLSTPNIALDSQVGLYLDGIYLGRAQSSGGDLSDIERVEVLRGPQGTLFGRNSTAGAINFITGSPTGKFSVDGTTAYGNYDRLFGRVTVNTPEFSGFSFRFNYQHEEYDGDVKNTAAGTTYTYGSGFGTTKAADRFGSRNSDSFIIKGRYTGIDDVQIDYKYDYSLTHETPPAVQGFGFISTTSGQAGAGLYLSQLPGAVPLALDKQLTVNQDGQAVATLRSQGHMVNASWDIDDHTTLKSITAYRKLQSGGPLDLDAGVWTRVVGTARLPFGFLHAINNIRQHQWSEEAQLLGKYDGFSYILGGFFFAEKGKQDQLQASLLLVPDGSGTIPLPSINQRDRTDNKAYAVYGHGDVDITGALDLALGARYTWDRRETVDARTVTPVIGKVNDNRLTYDAALTWTVASAINLYTRYAKGYVAGGFARGFAYDAESTQSYEAGVKSELFDRKLRLNGAVFHTDTKNRQTTVFVPGVGTAFFNIGSLKVDGFEIEATAVPVKGLTLTANAGYVDQKFSDGSKSVTPPRNYAFSAQYETPPVFDQAYLSFRVDADYRAKYYANNLNTNTTRAIQAALPAAFLAAVGYANDQQGYQTALLHALDGGDYWLANARIGLNDIEIGGIKARLTGYVRNIFNTRGNQFVIDYGVIAGSTFEQERTYGLEFGFRF